MSKTKLKVLFTLFFICLFISSCCFATIEPAVDDVPSTTQGDIALISEDGTPVVTSEDESNASVENADWTNSDLYMVKDKINISNIVDGNAFIIGQEVTISGEIGGDVFVIADKLNIEGAYIYSSIFACANEITINGVVYDIYATCDTFNLENNGYIYRDMKVLASNVNLTGNVRRDAYISAKNISFAESSDAIIYGNLHYTSPSELTIPEGIVSGEVTYTATSTENNPTIAETILSYVTDLLSTLFFTFIIAVIFLWLTPEFINRVGKMSVAKSFASLGIGFIAPIVLIIVGIILLLSSIGTSIFVCGTFAFIVLAYIGFSVTSIFGGKLLTKLLKIEGNVKFVLFTLISSIILWIICQIPIIGGFFSFIISIFGIGITLVNIVCRKEKVKEEIKKEE